MENYRKFAREQFEDFGPLHEDDCPVNDENGQDPCGCVVMDELVETCGKVVSKVLEEIRILIIDDVPHQYQERLFKKIEELKK